MGTSDFNAVVGAYWGIHFQAFMLQGLTKYKSPKTYWALKMVGRAIISGVLSVPFLYLHRISHDPD
jgi:hypothetical protein